MKASFGETLRALRKSKGLTLIALAELSGVSNPFLSQLETGKNTASPKTIKALEIALGVPQYSLMRATGHFHIDEAEKVSINELVYEAHQNAINKGWYEEPRGFGEVIALMHSELSEALEDYRNGKGFKEVWYEKEDEFGIVFAKGEQPAPEWKPCGIPTELADTVIRIFDTCGHLGIDLEEAIREKMAYNATRPIRHGGKKL